ncbi:MAG: hypothetical protein JXQ66_01320 [Campylobacterales bacterium]|nr:hypothetical protein [Campylobacterales bacterium]
MYKILLITTALLFGGCATKTEYNSVICDELRADPNQVIPSECKIYDEKIAEKSFNKVQNNKKTNDSDIIEYKNNEKDK